MARTVAVASIRATAGTLTALSPATGVCVCVYVRVCVFCVSERVCFDGSVSLCVLMCLCVCVCVFVYARACMVYTLSEHVLFNVCVCASLV